VLVFEDNVDAAESLRVILLEAGHQVGVETTGSRALEVIRAFRPDVVLCDLGLPEKDGYTIAAEVRSDKTLSPLRMIAISGYGAQEDQIRSKRAGFDVHLTKPVPPGLVLSEISKSREEAAP
jgi:CheY-like chemotaxis protein